MHRVCQIFTIIALKLCNTRYLKFEINWIMFAEFVKILMLVIVKKYLTLIFKF